LSDAECKELAKVTLTIMEIDKFADDTVVGETKVHVGEIISEGSEREFLQMKPAPYNVVLEDGTYKGVLRLGIKFISSVSLAQSTADRVRWSVPTRQPNVGYGLFLNLACPSIPWRRLFFFCRRSSDGQSGKKDM
ncbi:hypothetical protein BAE44_0016873, partial [Dichanthelium oligosanthes]